MPILSRSVCGSGQTLEEDVPSAWRRSRDKVSAQVQRVSVVSSFSNKDIIPSIYDPYETEEEDWPAVYGKKHVGYDEVSCLVGANIT